MTDLELTINDRCVLISEAPAGFVYEVYTDRNTVLADGGYFATQGEARKEAIRYMEKLGAIEAHEREEEEQDRRYGSYEEQVRSQYYGSIL